MGATALLIASKYEEIYPAELQDLVDRCEPAPSRTELLATEGAVLRALEHRITVPSACTFLVRYLKAGPAETRLVRLSSYVLEGTLQSYALLRYLPSQLAAAAVCIARRSLGRGAWSPALTDYARYSGPLC